MKMSSINVKLEINAALSVNKKYPEKKINNNSKMNSFLFNIISPVYVVIILNIMKVLAVALN